MLAALKEKAHATVQREVTEKVLAVSRFFLSVVAFLAHFNFDEATAVCFRDEHSKTSKQEEEAAAGRKKQFTGHS